jgi:uncharacterized damage-inducible protein DinB
MAHLGFVERRFSRLLGTLADMPPAPSLRAPGTGEFDPFYAGYLARVQHVFDPIGELTAQRGRVHRILAAVPEPRGSFRYAPGKWSIRELVGHLADAERIFGYRLLRIARGDRTALAGWDEAVYAQTAGFDARELRELADDWTAARDSTIALVQGLPDDCWERRGTANNAGVSARALLYIILGHAEHHLAVLAERYGVL